ncbi:MAG TPA: monovalent cation/H(+) antiporter subunit G, partial [Synergistales bacterium]|nr:monovalent cation/H(+) antiporter subunit G [Synergistales bacterium]
MAGGAFFSLASVIGIIRFPDIYTRIHAGTK